MTEWQITQGSVHGVEIGNEVAFDESFLPELYDKLPAITEEILSDMMAVPPVPSAMNSH
jgi:hypothetical protein